MSVHETHNSPTVLCIASDKGGVGKTATAAALCYSLAQRGNKVLLIDSDPQGNLSNKFGFGFDNRQENYIGKYIEHKVNHKAIYLEDFIHHNPNFPNIHIIVSDQRLDAEYANLDKNPHLSTQIFKILCDEVKALHRYDYIVIDTRPALRTEVGSALCASDYVLIPILAAADAIIGANDVFDYIHNLSEITGNPIKVAGVFFNRVSGRTKAFKELDPFVRDSWRDYVLQTIIPQSQDVVNAENNGMPVTKYAPKSKVSLAFEELLDEVVNRFV